MNRSYTDTAGRVAPDTATPPLFAYTHCLAQLQAEVKHWKALHADVVRRKRGGQIARDELAKTNAALQAENAGLVEKSQKLLEVVDKRWSFDRGQHHAHTWHDKQDCLVDCEKLIAALSPTTTEGGVTE